MTAGSDIRGFPQAGEIIDGKYRIENLLGIGGMGAVAKATHLLRRAPVALKFMSPLYATFPGAADRFVNEAVAASRITSDHVVQIFDVGKLADGTPFLVMEYLEGLDLAQLLARDGRPGLPLHRALHFTMQILRALEVAHGAEIVHRDMKPSNCFVVRKDGQDDFVKLLDFGISKVTAPDGVSLTLGNAALGTPLYMSPEQARSPRDVDARGDIYSSGVILYELLTGRTPFLTESGQVAELFAKLFSEDPEPLASLRPDLPPEIATIVHTALARDRNARFPTVVHFAEALAPYIGSESEPVLARIRQDVPGRLSHLLVPQSGSSPATFVGGTPRHVIAPPVDSAPRRSVEAATAETQYASVPPPAPTTAVSPTPAGVPGPPPPTPSAPPPGGATLPLIQAPVAARTDLAAIADATPSRPGRSPALTLGVAALALGGLAAGLWFASSRGDGPSAPPTPTAAALAPPSAAPAVPSATALAPEVTPSASAVVAPSAAPSAVAPRPKASTTAPTGTTAAPPPTSRPNPLDLKPIE